MLANSFSDDRQIIGIDLAEGMVDLANARCKEAGVRSVLYLCHQNHIAKVMKLWADVLPSKRHLLDNSMATATKLAARANHQQAAKDSADNLQCRHSRAFP